MGAQPDGRSGAAEGAAAVEGFARGGEVFEDDGEFVAVERDVGVGDVAVDEVVEPVRLDRDDAVAAGVSRRGDVGHARGDALGGGELEVGAVGEGRDDGVEGFDFVRFGFGGGAEDLGVGEGPEFAGVVGVLVGDEDFGNLFGLVAEVGEGFEVGLGFRADEYPGVRVRRRVGELGGQAGIDEDDFAAGVDDPVLEARAVLDGGVEAVGAFAAAGEGLGHEAVFGETDGEDFDAHGQFLSGLVG